MFSNYIKITLRKLKRNLAFSLITIMCLTVGFASFIMIYVYIQHELSFDTFHEGHDRMYRVLHHSVEETGERITPSIGPQLVINAKKQITGIEDLTYVMGVGRITVGNEVELRQYERIIMADTNFFDFFNYPMIRGEGYTALSMPNGIMLPESKARNYFKGELPMVGDSLYTNFFPAQVSGVVSDPPSNTSLDYGMVISHNVAMTNFPWYERYINTNWADNAFMTFVKLNEGTSPTQIEEEFTRLLQDNLPEDDQQEIRITLQPMSDVHFRDDTIQEGGNDRAIDKYYIYLFGTIGLLVLIVAAFNYMNLSTAAALYRTREIGLRKTIGATRKQLVVQFFTESAIITMVSLWLAVLITDLGIPWINNLGSWELLLPFGQSAFWITILITWFITALVASLYPAYVIRSIQPSQALKERFTSMLSGINLRKGLIVVQFAVSILMISGTFVVYQQLNHLRDMDKGFAMINRMTVDINSMILRRDFAAIKAEMLKIPSVTNVSVSSRVPGEWKNVPLARVRTTGTDDLLSEALFVGADKDFTSVFELDVLEGRNFSGSPADSLNVLISERMAEVLQLDDPIGTMIEIPEVNWSGDVEVLELPFRARVIGVVNNMQFESFREVSRPMVIAFRNNPIHNIDYYTVAFEGPGSETLEELRRVNDMFDPANPVEHHYLDEEYERFYAADEVRSQLFLVFASLVILISCFGLFALASFEIKRKTYEVGVRKVLGASSLQLTRMMLYDFLILIGVAFLVGLPFAVWLGGDWLNDFSSQLSNPWIYYIAAGAGALLLALLTTGVLTFRAANMKPVDTLRSE